MTVDEVSTAAAASPKKGTKKTSAVKKAKPSHPSTSDMVKAAITALKERNGSSAQAIKKYVAANYKVDVVKMTPYFRKALKSLVEKGVLTQTKGKGASGSFKLALKEKSVTKAAKSTEKPTSVKKVKTPKKPTVKKSVTKVKSAKKAVKKPVVAKKVATPKKAVAKKPAARKPVARKAAKKPAKRAAPKKA